MDWILIFQSWDLDLIVWLRMYECYRWSIQDIWDPLYLSVYLSLHLLMASTCVFFGSRPDILRNGVWECKHQLPWSLARIFLRNVYCTILELFHGIKITHPLWQLVYWKSSLPCSISPLFWCCLYTSQKNYMLSIVISGSPPGRESSKDRGAKSWHPSHNPLHQKLHSSLFKSSLRESGDGRQISTPVLPCNMFDPAYGKKNSDTQNVADLSQFVAVY